MISTQYQFISEIPMNCYICYDLANYYPKYRIQFKIRWDMDIWISHYSQLNQEPQKVQ